MPPRSERILSADAYCHQLFAAREHHPWRWRRQPRGSHDPPGSWASPMGGWSSTPTNGSITRVRAPRTELPLFGIGSSATATNNDFRRMGYIVSRKCGIGEPLFRRSYPMPRHARLRADDYFNGIATDGIGAPVAPRIFIGNPMNANAYCFSPANSSMLTTSMI